MEREEKKALRLLIEQMRGRAVGIYSKASAHHQVEIGAVANTCIKNANQMLTILERQ